MFPYGLCGKNTGYPLKHISWLFFHPYAPWTIILISPLSGMTGIGQHEAQRSRYVQFLLPWAINNKQAEQPNWKVACAKTAGIQVKPRHFHIDVRYLPKMQEERRIHSAH